jgi:hypothetical protein
MHHNTAALCLIFDMIGIGFGHQIQFFKRPEWGTGGPGDRCGWLDDRQPSTGSPTLLPNIPRKKLISGAAAVLCRTAGGPNKRPSRATGL